MCSTHRLHVYQLSRHGGIIPHLIITITIILILLCVLPTDYMSISSLDTEVSYHTAQEFENGSTRPVFRRRPRKTVCTGQYLNNTRGGRGKGEGCK